MSGEWEVVRDINPAVHVLPATGTDQVQHELDVDCVCGPRAEAVKRGDGSVGWIVVHASLDGRELTEDANHQGRIPELPRDFEAHAECECGWVGPQHHGTDRRWQATADLDEHVDAESS